MISDEFLSQVGQQAHVFLDQRVMLRLNHLGGLVDDRGDDHEVEKGRKQANTVEDDNVTNYSVIVINCMKVTDKEYGLD